MFKNEKDKPVIKLIINAPSKDKRALEAVEKKYIEEYTVKYEKLLINKKCIPKITKRKR